MKRVLLVVAAMLIALSLRAQTTKSLSETEIQGQQLAHDILLQRPAENADNTGVMQIRHQNGHHFEVPIVCRIVVALRIANTNIIVPDWLTLYQATLTNQIEYLRVSHTTGLTNLYSYSTNTSDSVPVLGDTPIIGHLFGSHQISEQALMSPFAGSDFWLCDLGLEFFHWPDQRILKHEDRRTRACAVLESTNPNPSPGA